MPVNPGITRAPQPTELFSEPSIGAAPALSTLHNDTLFNSPPIALAPRLESNAPAAQPAAAEPSFGEGFTSGVQDGLQGYADLVRHRGDALSGAAQGVGALLSGEGDTAAALREMLSGIREHPGHALGEFVAGLPLMLLPGGVAARLVGGAAKGALLSRGASKLVSSAAGLSTGVATGAVSSTAFAGALTNARGEELTPSDARLAAAFGAVFGGATRHADIHGTIHPAAQALRDKYPEAFAAAQDPASHADRLIHQYAGAESELGQRMADRMKETSQAQSFAQTVAEERYAPHEAAVKKLGNEQVTQLESLLKETDDRWDIRKQTNKGTLHITQKTLADRGVDKDTRVAYKAILDAAFENQKHVNAKLLELDPEATINKPQYGMLPRRWSNPHKVWYVDPVTEEIAVKGFDSPRKAREFADAEGGRFLNDSEFLNQPVQQIIDTVSKRDIMTDGVLDPAKMKAELQRAARSSRTRLSGFTAERKGRKGYDSLDSSGNLMAALRGDTLAVAKMQHVEPHLAKIDALAADADKLNLPITHALLKSVRDQAGGNVRASSIATTVKASFFHTFLSTFNVVAPTMNMLSAGLLTPAHLLTELRKQLGAQGLAEILPAMAATAKGLRSLIHADPELRKLIAANEREGATPTIASVNIGEPTTTRHGKIGSKLQAAARFNSYLMRKSEHMAKQMVGVAFREAGIAKGLTGHELTLFVHNGAQRTVGEFNAGMRPLMLTGNGTVSMDALAIATTFQSYVIQKVMADLPMIAHVSRPLAMTYLASIAVAAGAQGIPGVVPSLDYLVETVDPDGTLTAAWGKTKIEHNLVFHGVLSYTGASGRAEMSGPFGVGSQFGANPLGVAGTLVDMVSRIHDGMPITKGLLTIIPGDVKNRYGALKTLLNGDGKFSPPTASRHQSTYDVTTGEAVYTALTGLKAPSTVATQDEQGVAYDVSNKLTADRKALFNEALYATLDGTLTPAQRRRITRKFTHNIRGKSVRRFWRGVRTAARRNAKAAEPHLSAFAKEALK